MLSVGEHLLHELIIAVDLVLRLALDLGVFSERRLRIRKCSFQFDSGAACLRGMRLVYDDGKIPPCHLVHFLIDDREFLQGRDDDAHAVVDRIPQVFRGFLLVNGLDGT